MTTKLEGENGVLKRLHGVRVEMVRRDGQLAFEPVPGTEFSEDVDLIFLAMGFTGPEPLPLFAQLGVECDAMGRVKADAVTRQTTAPVCSSPVTLVAAPRSSSGRLPRDARRRSRWGSTSLTPNANA